MASAFIFSFQWQFRGVYCNKIKKIRFSHTSLTGYPTYRLIDKQGRMHHLNWPPE